MGLISIQLGFVPDVALSKRKNTTILWVRLPVGAGLSVRIVGSYGGHASGGYVTVRQLRKFLNTMVPFLWFADGHTSY